MQVINTVHQLSELKRQWISLPSVLYMPDYILDISELTGQQNDAISRKINNKIKTCGCFIAKFIVIAACSALIISYLTTGYFLPGIGLGMIIIGAGAVISVAMISRVLIILLARIQLIHLTNKTIRQALQARAGEAMFN